MQTDAGLLADISDGPVAVTDSPCVSDKTWEGSQKDASPSLGVSHNDNRRAIPFICRGRHSAVLYK